MWKILKINLLVSLILILFIEVVLISLNFLFDGVPMYRHFKITDKEVISFKKSEFKKKNKDTLDKSYIRSFDGYNKEKYLDEYLKKNQINNEPIFWMKGVDINFPIFFDKNNCRENNNENYKITT